MSIVKLMNSIKHIVGTRKKAKQKNYFNGVFPDATNKNHQIENGDTDEEVVKKRIKKILKLD